MAIGTGNSRAELLQRSLDFMDSALAELAAIRLRLEAIYRELRSHPERFVTGAAGQATAATMDLTVQVPPAAKIIIRRISVSLGPAHAGPVLALYENSVAGGELLATMDVPLAAQVQGVVGEIVISGGTQLVFHFTALNAGDQLAARVEGDLYPAAPSEV